MDVPQVILDSSNLNSVSFSLIKILLNLEMKNIFGHLQRKLIQKSGRLFVLTASPPPPAPPSAPPSAQWAELCVLCKNRKDVMEGSQFVEDVLNSIKLLLIFPQDLLKKIKFGLDLKGIYCQSH